ncbi:hypothetical protein DESAMIL20_16 [Desulfurella amilsii]|uniref:Uncharacterized protein n=1 Tax=Desulfurella amilsii TaxID=1562698 RepID=A0A1X4XZG0_9BACT|nr:hypothetical protein [Desulfurella amilsii]OSS42908.1 hypothetical protein DESAMIL20_16 [Desulfurella amilsii]
MIYLVCPFCKTEQDAKNKTCKEMQSINAKSLPIRWWWGTK